MEKKEDRGIDGPRPQWMDRGGDVEAHGELEDGDPGWMTGRRRAAALAARPPMPRARSGGGQSREAASREAGGGEQRR